MTEADLSAIREWMSQHVARVDVPLTARKFDVGQSNPTFLLEAGSERYVLRRKPSGTLLKSAHAVDREFRVQKALARSGVPVPRMLALCEDETVIGSVFYVMEHVAGRNIGDPSMPKSHPEERARIFAELGRVLAAIHEVDIERVGLGDYGPPGNYYERQLVRWTKQYRASETGAVAAMDDLIRWLGESLPPDDGQRKLVHGDYRIDNMLFAEDRAQCVAVLDWELSTIGHPFADLAGVIMQWQLPPGPEGRGLAGLDRASLGIPTDAEFIAQYCERRGIDGIENFGFYVAFAFFRMAAILQGVKKRAQDGNASNPEKALRLGTFVPQFAQLGLKAAQS